MIDGGSAFIREIADDRNSAAISESILTLVRSIGLCAIAEVVETENQLVVLQSVGCYMGHGKQFLRPVAAEEFSGLLTVDSTALSFMPHAGDE